MLSPISFFQTKKTSGQVSQSPNSPRVAFFCIPASIVSENFTIQNFISFRHISSASKLNVVLYKKRFPKAKTITPKIFYYERQSKLAIVSRCSKRKPRFQNFQQ